MFVFLFLEHQNIIHDLLDEYPDAKLVQIPEKWKVSLENYRCICTKDWIGSRFFKNEPNWRGRFEKLRTEPSPSLTDTSLGVTNCLQLEDIYSNTYLVKCARYSEKVRRKKLKKIVLKDLLE